MPPILETIIHWIHLVAAAGAFGGTIFLFAVIDPVLKLLDSDARTAFQTAARRKIIMVISHSYLLLIITGFINMFRVFSPSDASGPPPGAYVGILLIKIMLAFAMLTLAIMLLTQDDPASTFRKKRGQWLALAVVMGLVVFFISAWLRLNNQYGRADAAQSETIDWQADALDDALDMDSSGSDSSDTSPDLSAIPPPLPAESP